MTNLPYMPEIVKYRNPKIVTSRYPFTYEKYGQKQLAILRKKYALDKVIEGKNSEFDKILALRSWVCAQWVHGWDHLDGKCKNIKRDAVQILEAARKGYRFSCGYYATVFVQCALSLGFQARCVGVQKDLSRIPFSEVRKLRSAGHSVAEIWSDELAKWVLMDADMNAHYEYENMPLNALEIRRFWMEKKWKRVRFVRGTPKPGILAYVARETPEVQDAVKEFLKYRVMDHYCRISVLMRNNWFEVKGDKGLILTYADSSMPPSLRVFKEHEDVWTENADDMYWSLNQTLIKLKYREKQQKHGVVEVTLENTMPNFEKYLVRTGVGRWVERPARFKWSLKKGSNTIQAKSVSRFQVVGPASLVRIRFR